MGRTSLKSLNARRDRGYSPVVVCWNVVEVAARQRNLPDKCSNRVVTCSTRRGSTRRGFRTPAFLFPASPFQIRGWHRNRWRAPTCSRKPPVPPRCLGTHSPTSPHVLEQSAADQGSRHSPIYREEDLVFCFRGGGSCAANLTPTRLATTRTDLQGAGSGVGFVGVHSRPCAYLTGYN